MGPKKSKFRTPQKVLDFIFSSERPFPAVQSPTTPLLTSTPGESDEKVQLAINEEKTQFTPGDQHSLAAGFIAL